MRGNAAIINSLKGRERRGGEGLFHRRKKRKKGGVMSISLSKKIPELAMTIQGNTADVGRGKKKDKTVLIKRKRRKRNLQKRGGKERSTLTTSGNMSRWYTSRGPDASGAERGD